MENVWIIIVFILIITWGIVRKTRSFNGGCRIKPKSNTPRPKVKPAPQSAKRKNN